MTHFLLYDFYEFFETRGYVVGKIYPNYVDFRAYDLNDEDFLGPQRRVQSGKYGDRGASEFKQPKAQSISPGIFINSSGETLRSVTLVWPMMWSTTFSSKIGARRRSMAPLVWV